MKASCTDNLLRLLGTDCSQLTEGNYLINIVKHQAGCNCCTSCTTGECTATLVFDSGSSFSCSDVTNCINTNALTRDAIRTLLINLLTNDATIRSIICGIDCGPAPTVPNDVTNLSTTDAGGGAYDCGNPILTWTASSGATSYDVFEGATLLGNTATTTFTVTGASVGSHTYIVKAVNAVGSSSGVSVTVNVTNCLTAPGNITNLSATDSGGGSYDCGAPILNWVSSPTATSYDIMEGATLVANVTGNTYTFPSQPTSGSHTYTVVAKNGAGSASGVNITVTIVDCLTAPGNVSGTINVYNSGTATTYTCGTDFDVDFTDVATATYYQLFEGATQIGSNSSTSNFVVTGQTVGSHTYTIKACNGAGCSTGTNFTVNLVACPTTGITINVDNFSYLNPYFTISNPNGETILQTGIVVFGPYANPTFTYYPDPTLADTIVSYGTAMAFEFTGLSGLNPSSGYCYTYRVFCTTNLGTTYSLRGSKCTA